MMGVKIVSPVSHAPSPSPRPPPPGLGWKHNNLCRIQHTGCLHEMKVALEVKDISLHYEWPTFILELLETRRSRRRCRA